MKLIELNGDKRPVFVNIDAIVTIEAVERFGGDGDRFNAEVITSSGRFLPVRETVDQILAKLPAGAL
jgi:uncharacterized protein YlzI (FlbEa/FlbD family)